MQAPTMLIFGCCPSGALPVAGVGIFVKGRNFDWWIENGMICGEEQ